MQISQDMVVTLQYRLFDAEDQLLDQTREPLAYLHGGYGNMPPKLEAAMLGKQAGDQVAVTLLPADSFGEYDEALVREEPKSLFPAEVAEGMVFQAQDPQSGHTLLFRVLELSEDKVKLDGNHPFAGMTVRFEVEIQDVRAASDEEKAHGHVHGEHGHHH
ncbi:peptidylprolyl isomerase [Pseudaeromonas sp. ZJS20]|uniref:FKBP-type peptidyl-prolyl cis-trans isomerase n=1 Tax=Pseudaeromonas aegiceratis TaxID=3153928 RepID=UPI00390C5887